MRLARLHPVASGPGGRRWEVTQTLLDPEGDNVWAIFADIDLRDATAADGPILRIRRVEGALVASRAGVPFQVRGIAIEIVMPRPGESFLAEALDGESGSPLAAPRLVYMKPRAPRHKDRTDVIELIKIGIDVEACRSLLSTNAPDLLPDLESAVCRARSEE